MSFGDVDPSYEMLRYLCRRFELNTEQRYWLAFLYATCYCGPTVYYIYNEFPDFENVDEDRLEWWWKANRSKLYFQTDRRWIRSRNFWCDVFRSYKKFIGPQTQREKFNEFVVGDKYANYDCAWKNSEGIYQFGRFALFLYLEAVHVVTDFPMRPKTMDIRTANSCRNGLAFAIGRPDLNTHDSDQILETGTLDFLQSEFDRTVETLEKESPRNSVWNIETTLCAYKKYCLGKRHVGYYLDRQADEIEKLQSAVTEGVDWSVLWDYRRETYSRQALRERR